MKISDLQQIQSAWIARICISFIENFKDALNHKFFNLKFFFWIYWLLFSSKTFLNEKLRGKESSWKKFKRLSMHSACRFRFFYLNSRQRLLFKFNFSNEIFIIYFYYQFLFLNYVHFLKRINWFSFLNVVESFI